MTNVNRLDYNIEYWYFFISGIVWIVFSVFLAYLTYEHHSKRRYPQNIILFLFTAGSIARTIWFFNYVTYGVFWPCVVISRVAILLQLSGLSILVLMWSRAVNIIPKTIERMQQQPRNSTEGISTVMSIISKETKESDKSNSSNSVRITSEQATERAKLVYIQRLCVLMNFILWSLILGTLANQNAYWYLINIILLSVMCIIEAIVIFIVGIRTAVRLHNELAPIYTNPSETRRIFSKSLTFPYHILLFIYSFNDTSNNRSLLIQKQIVRTLLTTSTIISLCFIIRSVCFYFSFEILV